VSGARWLARLRPDPYILAILAMVAIASFLPARGQAADGLSLISKVLIGLLFFFHGAKLSREAVIAGLAHWRLHVTVLAATFVLFLACLPSTVQSSIAFTAIARGNVAAAVCAASASNLFGIFITPALVGRQLTVSPLALFLSLAFWTWLWGPLGTFLATPILIAAVVVREHTMPSDELSLPD